MLHAIRTGQTVTVRGYTILPGAALYAADLAAVAPNVPHVSALAADRPLISAPEERLMADPLLSLELEMTSTAMVETIALNAKSNAAVARSLLTRWERTPGEVFTDRITLEEADALACWANGTYIALRRAEADAAGRRLAVGESSGLEQMLTALTGAEETTEEIEPVAAVMAYLAESFSAAISGRNTD